MADRLRVSLYRNGDDANKKALVVPADWTTLLAKASKKTGCDARRIFTKDGAEVEAVSELIRNDVLWVSEGEAFAAPGQPLPPAMPKPEPELEPTSAPAPAPAPAEAAVVVVRMDVHRMEAAVRGVLDAWRALGDRVPGDFTAAHVAALLDGGTGGELADDDAAQTVVDEERHPGGVHTFVAEVERAHALQHAAEVDVQVVPPTAEVPLEVSAVPVEPFPNTIARALCAWGLKGRFPHAWPPQEGLVEVSEERTRMEAFGAEAKMLYGLLNDADALERGVHDLFVRMGVRGVLSVMGMRRTVGSYDRVPPGLRTCVRLFTRRHAERISVGARALSKHCHRDSVSQWWSSGLTGRQVEKNAAALDSLQRVLGGAEWVNLHHLPGGKFTYEIRHKDGFGVRWTSEGDGPWKFRGFLEPQRADGHATKWRRESLGVSEMFDDDEKEE